MKRFLLLPLVYDAVGFCIERHANVRLSAHLCRGVELLQPVTVRTIPGQFTYNLLPPSPRHTCPGLSGGKGGRGWGGTGGWGWESKWQAVSRPPLTCSLPWLVDFIVGRCLLSDCRQVLSSNHPCVLSLVIHILKREYRYVHIVQELCKSRGGRPGLSALTSLLVSVDVKNY